jgi:hypothetical protein
MAVGCTQDVPLGSSDPSTPNRADLLRSAVRVHVDLLRGTAVTISPDARTATAAGLSLALVGDNELQANVTAIARSAVGEFTKKKVRVTMSVALVNKLTNAAFVAPTFPAPPAGSSGLLLFPFSTTVSAGSGNIAPSPDWDGAPINFFNDTDAGCSLYKSDCYRYEAYPAPLTGGSGTAARTVGFDVDPTVTAFDTYFVLAADLSNLGVVTIHVGSKATELDDPVPAAGATVTLRLTPPIGVPIPPSGIPEFQAQTDAAGNAVFLNIPANIPFAFGSGFSVEDGDGYLVEVDANVCGTPHHEDNSGQLGIQAGQSVTQSFQFNCFP